MPSSSEGYVRSLVEKAATRTLRWLHALDEQGEREAFLARLLRALPGMAYRQRADRERTMEFVSYGCRTLTGFEPADLVHNLRVSYAEVVHPDDREMVLEVVQDAVRRRGTFQIAYRIRRVDGTERRVWEQGSAVIGEGGAPVIEGIVTDISDHQDLVGRLSATEGRFRALVEQSLAGIYVVLGDRFTYVNTRFADIFRYSVEEILALSSILDLVHPDDRDLVEGNVRRRIRGEVTDIRYQFRGRAKHGGTVHVEVHGRRIIMDGAPAVLGTLLDVSERERAERASRDAEKLEAQGRLAAGVAHDLNNFLSTIRSTAEVLMLERADEPSLKEDLAGIVAAVDRGVALSRQLTRFGRSEYPAGLRTSPSTALDDLVRRLGPMLGRRIELHVDVPRDLPEIRMSPADLEEVVMSLVVNAQDAIPQSGRMVVRAILRSSDGSLTSDPAQATDVSIEVQDTGAGIPDAVRPRVFEPEFTTKGEKGTGLGLANAWRCVGQAGGTIEVESTEGVGSTFRVILPISHPRRPMGTTT
jgi:PAS domain S-box-containing protein